MRISNLSEEADEQDLHDLFHQCGRITQIYVAKDEINNTSKGFAFITFARRKDAQTAIDSLNGFGYDHLILRVE